MNIIHKYYDFDTRTHKKEKEAEQTSHPVSQASDQRVGAAQHVKKKKF